MFGETQHNQQLLNQNVCFSNDSPKPLVALFGIMAFCTQNFIIISKNLILQNAW